MHNAPECDQHFQQGRHWDAEYDELLMAELGRVSSRFDTLASKEVYEGVGREIAEHMASVTVGN